MFGVPSELGLTAGELCKSTSTPVAIVTAKSSTIEADITSGQPRRTEIEVIIKSNGVVSGAHIIGSSGDDDRDAQALELAYHTTYKPATRKCVAVQASGRFQF